jgi:hypothetical protein
LKLSRLPKIEDPTKDGVSHLWPTYINRKGRTLAKTYWIKARFYWEHALGIHWEPVGNKGKMKKPSTPRPPGPKTRKKKRAL